MIEVDMETQEWIKDFCKAHNLGSDNEAIVKLIDCYKAWNTTLFHGFQHKEGKDDK